MLYETLDAAFKARDIDAILAAYHPDYTFVRHQSDLVLSLADWTPMMEKMVADENWVIHENRCLYENDDILVLHSMMSFPDGSREAVMAVHTKKDGKLFRTETGATPL